MKNCTIQQMMALIQLADQRIVYTISFRIAKIRLEQALAGQAPDAYVDDLTMKCRELLATIHEIDACFAEFFIATGRLN